MKDSLKLAKERYQEATEAMRDTHARMREDLDFSNPADPQQWDKAVLELRKGRPCLRFDRTNQFIAQVVNAARQNKPSITVLPVDSKADPEVAEKLNGIIRHIEYTSRASIAYDTAIEYAARIGLGWLRVVPEIVRPETNEQEIRIKRIHDPLSVYLDPNSTEPDGSDAMWALVETTLTKKAFERLYPKAKVESWQSDGWFSEDSVRICEHLYITETTQNRIVTDLGPMTEDEYWQVAQQTGIKPQVVSTFEAIQRSVKWCKVSGAEILEETDFPSQFLPVVPVLGYELWSEGKRHLCGMVRRLMDGQRAYNYERSAFIEAVALQPKAPFLVPGRAIEGYEDQWGKLNVGNPAYVTYNDVDPDSGTPVNPPSRLGPPAFPAAFAQGGEMASRDMEAALGMFDANLGNQGTAVSGRAKLADQNRGDLANFHYVDNLSRSIEQLGRVVVDMIPRIYDTARIARIMGEDGSPDFVSIDPEMPQPARLEGRKVVAINPNVGAYDVRVKSGPSYPSLRAETAEQLSNIFQAAPQMIPVLGDVWVGMQDWPEADKIAKRLKAMLPPQIQELENEDAELPPEAVMQLQQMSQQLQQMQQALEQAGQEAMQARAEAEAAKLNAQKAGVQTQQANLKTEFLQAQQQLKDMLAQEQPQQPEMPAMPAAPTAPQPAPVSVVLPNMAEQIMPAMAEALQSSQMQILEELQRTAQTLQSAQEQTALALQQVAQMVGMPREITLVKDDAGRNVGARSEIVSS